MDGMDRWGWAGLCNGLSAITRCRATPAQDGLIDAVDFDAHDRFCLDGEKLIAVEGEYGAEGTIYYYLTTYFPENCVVS